MIAQSQIFAYLVIIPSEAAVWVGWVVLVVAIALGVGAGFLVAKLISVGVFILGFWLGAAIGTLLYNLALHKISDEGSSIILWATIAILGIIAGVIAIRVMEPAIMISTAFVGAYAFVRGISLFAGHYPGEYEVVTGLSSGSYEMPWQFYVYFAAIMVLAAIGSVF